MDTSEPDIVFDEAGVCNHCKTMQVKLAQLYRIEPLQKAALLTKEVNLIKAVTKGKYHCLVGVSGGVDSSYTALKVKELGLNALLFHLDNGWGTLEAVHNIKMIVNHTGFDYECIVLDWHEFKDLQVAYLRSSVVDIEAPTDHAIWKTSFKLAAQHHIKTIITGENASTEAILPATWHYNNKLTDSVNIQAIYKKFTRKKLRNFPLMSYEQFLYYTRMAGIKTFPLLNYLEYDKKEVKQYLVNHIGWKDYGGKHYESAFTRFYQGYILPRKFGIDKRRAHLSTLIVSGQLTREEALEILKTPALTEEMLKKDLAYIPKKLSLSTEEFEAIMELPPMAHTHYKTDSYKRGNVERLKKVFKFKQG